MIRAVKEKYRAFRLGEDLSLFMRHLISLVIGEYKSQWDSISPFDCQTLRSCAVASIGKNIDHWLFMCCWPACKQMQALWKTIWYYLVKLYVHLWHNLAFLLLSVKLPWEAHSRGHRWGILRMFLVALLILAKNWKPRCSSAGGWVKTFWSHDGLLSGSNTNAQPFPCNDLCES